MKRLPKIKITFIDPENVSQEEQQKVLGECYDILFKEVIKMMETSSDPAHLAFLKKFPYLKEKTMLE